MGQADLFNAPTSEHIREAEGCEYVAQGWRGSAAQARRDGFPEAADRYDVHGAYWEEKARLAREAASPAERPVTDPGKTTESNPQ